MYPLQNRKTPSHLHLNMAHLMLGEEAIGSAGLPEHSITIVFLLLCFYFLLSSYFALSSWFSIIISHLQEKFCLARAGARTLVYVLGGGRRIPHREVLERQGRSPADVHKAARG